MGPRNTVITPRQSHAILPCVLRDANGTKHGRPALFGQTWNRRLSSLRTQDVLLSNQTSWESPPAGQQRECKLQTHFSDLTMHQIQSSDLLHGLSRYLIDKCFYCQTAVALKISHDFHAFTDFLRVVGLRPFKVSKHIQVTSRPTSPPLAAASVLPAAERPELCLLWVV